MRLRLQYPVQPPTINQVFGVNGDYYQKNGINITGHNGIDFRAYHGQEVYASHDGIVTYAGLDNREGLGIVLRTKEQVDYDGGVGFVKTIYWHLKDVSVTVGQEIRLGQLIGHADNTGLSTGDHLHFGLKPILKGENDWTWWNAEPNNGYGGAIDPAPYFIASVKPEDTDLIENLTLQKTLLERVVELYKQLLAMKK